MINPQVSKQTKYIWSKDLLNYLSSISNIAAHQTLKSQVHTAKNNVLSWISHIDICPMPFLSLPSAACWHFTPLLCQYVLPLTHQLSFCLSVWSQSDLPLGFCRQKEVINTATMTTDEPDTRLGSCSLMAFLGILAFNSSRPAFTWADIKTLGMDEGAVATAHFADGPISMWDETV